MKADKKKATAKRQLNTRRGVVLIIALAVLILVVNIITASFSWFSPNKVAGSGMVYEEDGGLRGEDCKFSTYLGTRRTTYETGKYIDQMEYPGEALTSAVPIPAGETRYFRTSIVNSEDYPYPSVISLYISQIGQSGSNLRVAVTYPSNTVRDITGRQDDYYIVRNAYVKAYQKNDVDGPGLLQIDWFVTNNGSSQVSIDIPKLYLMYN